MTKCARCDKKWILLPVNLPLLSDCNETWIFSTNVRKIFKCQISWKFVEWESSCSLPKDGQTKDKTDMTKLIDTFRNFTKTPNSTNKIEIWKVVQEECCVVIQGRSCQFFFRGSCHKSKASRFSRPFSRDLNPELKIGSDVLTDRTVHTPTQTYTLLSMVHMYGARFMTIRHESIRS